MKSIWIIILAIYSNSGKHVNNEYVRKYFASRDKCEEYLLYGELPKTDYPAIAQCVKLDEAK
jgi:hypothetical protein